MNKKLKELSQDKSPGSFWSTYEQLQGKLKNWSGIENTVDATYKSDLKKGLSQYYREMRQEKNVKSKCQEVQHDKNLMGRNNLNIKLATRSEENGSRCKEGNKMSKELITEHSSIKDIMYFIY